jgi:rare lipoprotein A
MRTATIRLVAISLTASSFAGCAAAHTPVTRTSPVIKRLAVAEGLATYYGEDFHGKRTASGAAFDMNAMVAAHPRYPFGTLVRVTNLRNGRSTQVRIVDRGPAPERQADGVIIDVSRQAAQSLDFIRAGRTRVRLEVLQWGKLDS